MWARQGISLQGNGISNGLGVNQEDVGETVGTRPPGLKMSCDTLLRWEKETAYIITEGPEENSWSSQGPVPIERMLLLPA